MEYTIKIIQKKMKHMRMRVNQKKEVIVSAPPTVPLPAIHEFIENHKPWIEAQMQKINILEYHDGDEIKLFGKVYYLSLQSNGKKRARILLQDDVIIMENVEELDRQRREKLLHTLYKTKLMDVVPEMIEDYCLIMKVSVSEVKYQHMTSRWGSCHIQKHVIKLNTKLAQYPIEAIEGVVVHELVHLLEPSHNARFYQLMDHYYPNWRQYDAVLKKK